MLLVVLEEGIEPNSGYTQVVKVIEIIDYSLQVAAMASARVAAV